MSYGQNLMADARNQTSPSARSPADYATNSPPNPSILFLLSELTDQSVQLGMMAGEVLNSLTLPGPEDGKCSPPLPRPGCVTEYLHLIRAQMKSADNYLRQILEAVGGGNVASPQKDMAR